MPATGIDTLAPDQRAAVQLVLRQGLSYAELSEMLGMPEETIRARARGGLEALAPDLPAPTRSGEIADWLLGQQSSKHAARTRELLLSDPAAKKWAETVAKPLRKVPGGESVPELPGTSRENGKPRSAREAPREEAAGAESAPAPRPDAPAREAPPRSSRLGGALLIGGAVAIVAVVLAFVFLRGDDPEPAAETPTAATPSPTPSAVGLQPGDVVMQGPAGSKALAVLRLVSTGENRIEFALVGQDIPPNAKDERYSLWFSNADGKAQLVGDLAKPVGENGQLASSGPGEDNIDDFPTWFQSYETASITQDEPGAKEPGRVIVSGPLPDTSG